MGGDACESCRALYVLARTHNVVARVIEDVRQ